MANRFGMRLDVRYFVRIHKRAWRLDGIRIGALSLLVVLGAGALSFSAQAPSQTAIAAPSAQSAAPQTSPTTPSTAPTQGIPQGTPPPTPRAGLNVVVLDPAH